MYDIVHTGAQQTAPSTVDSTVYDVLYTSTMYEYKVHMYLCTMYKVQVVLHSTMYYVRCTWPDADAVHDCTTRMYDVLLYVHTHISSYAILMSRCSAYSVYRECSHVYVYMYID